MRLLILTVSVLAVLALVGCGPPPAAPAPPEGMVLVSGGSFRMGVNGSPWDYEGPVHEVTVKSFFIDRTEVTNRQFAEFVKATKYVSVAEKYGWSGVFDWKTGHWAKRDRAQWRTPEGDGTSIQGRDDFPVVQVCHEDAEAYAAWAGKRLPTEAEWEYAARGGPTNTKYPWGDELNPAGKYLANYWQGPFPKKDEGSDGFHGIAPVAQFPPNSIGLFDVGGNVWEMVHDRFSDTYYSASPAQNPQGPADGDQFVIRGGSFLCAENWCQGYRVAARNFNDGISATPHMGFRCVRDVDGSRR